MTATIYESDGTTVEDWVTLEDLFGDRFGCPDYPQDNSYLEGGVPVDQPPWNPGVGSETGTWPLSTILGCLERTHLTKDDVLGGVTILGSDGARSDLARESIFPPTDFPGGRQPLVISKGTTFEYHRPSRGGGDDNAKDKVPTDSDSPLHIEVSTRALLTVGLTASPSSIDEGGTVTFTATPAGSGYTYEWDAGDGRSKVTTSTPSHSFRYDAQAVYRATVHVTSPGASGWQSVLVTVKGDVQPEPTPGPTPAGVPDGSDGPAPSGPAAPHGRSPGTPKGSGNGRPTNPGSKHGGKPQPGAPGQPQPTATPATPSSADGTGGSGTSIGGGGGSQSSRQDNGAGRRQPATRDRTRRERAPATGLERVTGRLVSDVIPLSAVNSPLVTEVGAPRGSPARERRHVEAGPLPAIIAGTLAVVLLLALGAARELDVRWRTLLPRMGG